MSLKGFHLVFITASVIVTSWFGIWALKSAPEADTTFYHVLSAGSLVASAGLAVYLIFCVRKFKNEN